MWGKIKAWFGHSTTILWARIVALAGAAATVALDLLNDQTISAQVQAILNPKYVPFYLIAIGVVTELCRWRTAGTAQ